MNDAIRLIEYERRRQVERGYTAAHDDKHTDGSIALAAEAVLAADSPEGVAGLRATMGAGDVWPFKLAMHIGEKYAGDKVRIYTIAAAMLAAEIERLHRAAAAEPGQDTVAETEASRVGAASVALEDGNGDRADRLTVDFTCSKCGNMTPAIAEIPPGTLDARVVDFSVDCHHCDEPLKRSATIGEIRKEQNAPLGAGGDR
jgi:hypothetical protein